MVERIDFDAERRMTSMAYYTLIMTLAGNKEQNKLLDKVPSTPGKLDVTLIINGVEFPFLNTMARWDQEIDRLVANEAKKLIREKFLALEDKLAQFSDSVDALISEHFPEEE